jgi:hypothetical protein
MMLGLRFFAVGGVILILTGILKLAVNPRAPGAHRLLNRGSIWPLFWILFGVAAVLVGLGLVPLAAPG